MEQVATRTQPMTPATVWPAIMDDHLHGHVLRSCLSLLCIVPTEAIQAAIARIETETATGPLTNPSAYLDGRRFANAATYKEILQAVLAVRKLLPDESGGLSNG